MTRAYEANGDVLHNAAGRRILAARRREASKVKLEFPGVAEDLSDAFNNAIAQGVMQREDRRDLKTFFAKFELIVSEIGEDEEIIADWFFHELSNIYHRIERRDGAE